MSLPLDSESKATAFGPSRVDSVRAWAVLVLGLATLMALYRMAPGAFAAFASAGRVEPRPHLWLASMVGQKLHLPARDSQGNLLFPSDRRFVVVLSCSSCSISTDPPQPPTTAGPLIIVMTEPLKFVPKALLGRPEKYLVVCDPNATAVPLAMHERAPQAAVIDRSDVVLLVPAPGQDLSAFLTGARQ